MTALAFLPLEGEILAWLQIHDAVNEPWVALDDAYWKFERCKDHLVVCGSFTGFDDKASAELRTHFEECISMKVLILSDLHLEFAPFEPVADLEFDAVILAGDIHSPAKRAVQWAADRFRGKPVIYLLGNHEYYDGRTDTTLAEARREAEGSNVHLLDGDELVVDGVRFLGATLWTDFALAIETPEGPVSDVGRAMKMATNLLNDYALIRTFDEAAEPNTWRDKQGRKLQAADTLRIHQAQRAWLRDRLSEPFAGPTVVVTHHAPHRGSLAQRYADDWSSGAFVTELPDTFFEVPALWIHGHTHQSFDYGVRSCRIVCNPRGYVNWSGRIENKAFDPGLVIDANALAGDNGS